MRKKCHCAIESGTASLDSIEARRRLETAGKPYYHILQPRLHIGYRKGQKEGKWVMRWYIGHAKYKVETIAIADDKRGADGATVFDYDGACLLVRARYTERLASARGLGATGLD